MDEKSNVYLPLPMFHGVAMYSGVLPTFGSSATLVLARKFSLHNFWIDVERNDVDCFLYVGELCRYLVQAPKNPAEERVLSNGRLRFARGLGMSEQIWRQVRDRFNIEVFEYFSASEATTTLANYNKGPFGIGGVTHEGPIARYFNMSWKLLQHNTSTGEVTRNSRTGLCNEAPIGEPGEIVMAYNSTDNPFHGYHRNDKATEEKVIRDVAVKGDAWLRVGDLLLRVRIG